VIEMIIRNNTIHFKSDDEFYQKESSDLKNNTVRCMANVLEEQGMIDFYYEYLDEQKSIAITNLQHPLKFFVRTIRNISKFYSLGTCYWIITWIPAHNVPCTDLDKCIWIKAAAEAQI